MGRSWKDKIRVAAQSGEPIDEVTAVELLGASHDDLAGTLAAAQAVTSRSFGSSVSLCAIANVRSGNCSEDCVFCAQSSHFKGTPAPVYPLMEVGEIRECAARAGRSPVEFFSYVTSGRALGREPLDRVCEAVDGMRETSFSHCASLGCLDFESLKKLRESGVVRYHHNLESAESFFGRVCTTHSYAERIRTVRDARRAGLQVCCGGLLGLGESREQRVELALAIAAEKVDSIPLNFLVPIPGTPLEGVGQLEPLEILLSIAMFRLTNPQAEVRMAAGRGALRSLQAFIFHAGCNGLMVGDFLTVSGQGIDSDLTMLSDLGLKVRRKA